MGTIVDVLIPAEQIALEHTLSIEPEASFEPIQVTAHGNDSMLPFVWASGTDFEKIADALSADKSVDEVNLITENDRRCLFQIEWGNRLYEVIDTLAREQRTLLTAFVDKEGWNVSLLFPSEASVSATFDDWQEQGLRLSVRCVYDISGAFDKGGFDLTDHQYDALIAALAADYYKVPRGITLEELSHQLGVSHQALSERLRRGHQTIIRDTLQNGPVSHQSIKSHR